MVFIFYFIFFVFLLLLILQSKVNIIFILHRVNGDDNVKVKFSLLNGLIKFNFKIPYVDFFLNSRLTPEIKFKNEITNKANSLFKKKGIFNFNDAKKIIDIIESIILIYKRVFKYLISKTSIDYIKWYTKIGLEDAAYTAICTGILWAFKYNMLGIISKKIMTSKIDTKVVPDYKNFIFSVEFHCIINLKVVNIIIAGIKMLNIFLFKFFFEKGSKHNERTSYSGINENHNGQS